MDVLFDLDYQATEKIIISDGKILGYTDNGITLTASGTSDATLDADGIKLGTGKFSDSGARLQHQGNIPFNHAFLVVKEGRLGTTSAYNKVFMATQEENSSVGWQNGLMVAINFSPNVRSIFRRNNSFVSHQMKVNDDLVQQASMPTLSILPAGTFKVIKVKLPSNNAGGGLSIGSLFASINTTTYSQAWFKKLVLAQCTEAEGDQYFTDLKALYQPL